MIRNSILATLFSMLLTFTAFAADVNGKWVGQVPGRGGDPVETTFVFKVEGGRLTGTVTSPQGERPILDGKVEGDAISFAVEDPERGKRAYKGTLAGDELKMSREGRNGPREFTAKRSK